MVLFKFSDVAGITGYSILSEVYGGVAPVVLVLIVVILIALYVKLIEN